MTPESEYLIDLNINNIWISLWSFQSKNTFVTFDLNVPEYFPAEKRRTPPTPGPVSHASWWRCWFLLRNEDKQKTERHLDGERGDALRAVHVVQHAEVTSVLGHHHVAAGHPLDVGAEAQNRGLHGALQVVQMELRRTRREEDIHSSSVLLSFPV